MTEVTPEAVLALPMNAGGASTVGEYLIALLDDLWREKDGFSGKYGMTGESDWMYDLYRPLIMAGMIEDASEADLTSGYGLSRTAIQQADDLIGRAIRSLAASLRLQG
jgi:hypothetical protein